jgi:hypothetical protein
MVIMQTKQEGIAEQQNALLHALKLFAVGFEVAGALRDVQVRPTTPSPPPLSIHPYPPPTTANVHHRQHQQHAASSSSRGAFDI